MVTCNVLITRQGKALAILHNGGGASGTYGLPEQAGEAVLSTIATDSRKATCESFLDALLGLVDPQTGSPLFELISREDRVMCDFVYHIDFPGTEGVEVRGRGPVAIVRGFPKRFAEVFASGEPAAMLRRIYEGEFADLTSLARPRTAPSRYEPAIDVPTAQEFEPDLC